MIVNMTTIDTLEKMIDFVKDNPAIAKWTYDRALIFEHDKIYISSIEFFDEDDCLFYSLKFGLR